MKILIADDHIIVRRGLRTILAESYPYAHIDEVGDTIDLLKCLQKETYNIIISDISMPGRSGLEAIKDIKEIAPSTPVLILSVHTPDQYAIRAIKAGASGYLTKESAPEELIKAVEHILPGRKYITPDIAEILAESYAHDNDKVPHEYLSEREFEILKRIGAGKSITSIGEELHISINTVSTYRARLLEKMNMKTNADLIKYVLQTNLLD